MKGCLKASEPRKARLLIAYKAVLQKVKPEADPTCINLLVALPQGRQKNIINNTMWTQSAKYIL